MRLLDSKKGFTLVEILIVLALIAILVGVVIVTLNPARQFANSRNTTRYSHLNTIMNAISANMAENSGIFTCASGDLPAVATNMSDDVAGGDYDMGTCLVTDYLSSMPYDPSDTDGHWTSVADYDTGYTILQDAADGRITIDAPSAELTETISITR